MKANSSPSGRIEYIQLLRLFAAICITVYHSRFLGEHGYFGVELFSMISGFILLYSTEKTGSVHGFLRKRLIRIVPLYWLATIAMYFLITLMPSLSIMSEADPVYLIKSLCFIPFVNSKGYDTPVLGVGWTLNYEMLLYLLFFIALHISHRYHGIICGAFMLLLVILGHIPGCPYILSYYGNTFLLEFGMGMLAYRVWKQLSERTLIASITHENVPGNAAESIAENAPEGAVGNVPANASGNVPESAAGNAASSAVGNTRTADDNSASGKLSGSRFIHSGYDVFMVFAAVISLLWMAADIGSEWTLPRFIRLGVPAWSFFLCTLILCRHIRIPALALRLGNATYSLFLIEYFTTAIYKVFFSGMPLIMQILPCICMLLFSMACSLVSYEIFEKRLAGWLRRRLL